MVILNTSFKDYMKNIILQNKTIGHHYKSVHRNTKYTLDTIIDGIFYVLKTGLGWRDVRLPIQWQTLYWHFKRFSSANIFHTLFVTLRDKYIQKIQPSVHIIDTTFISNKYGRDTVARNKFFKNKQCNKISAVTDIYGVPLSVVIDSGNVHDLKFVPVHLSDLCCINKSFIVNNKTLLADKGYTSEKIRIYAESNHYKIIVPAKKNSLHKIPIDKQLYKHRIHVEHFFQKLKQFRRIPVRYDASIASFSSFVLMAFSVILLRYFK